MRKGKTKLVQIFTIARICFIRTAFQNSQITLFVIEAQSACESLMCQPARLESYFGIHYLLVNQTTSQDNK